MISPLDQIRERLSKATPGPFWTFNGTGVFTEGKEGLSLPSECQHCGASFDCDNIEADSEFLAHARTDVEKLIKALELAVEQRNLAIYDASGCYDYDPETYYKKNDAAIEAVLRGLND